MGSAKHMRSNGEQISIHGHDNYQMPGDFKQMGDTNQNQPYKISGGAAKGMAKHYAPAQYENPITKPDDPDKKKLIGQSKEDTTLPSYDEKKVDGKTSGGGGSESTANYDAAVKAEGTKQVDPKLITKEMTANANAKRKAAREKDASINSKATTNNSSSTETKTLGNESPKQIETRGQVEIKNRLDKFKASREDSLNTAASDSTNTSNLLIDKGIATHGAKVLKSQPFLNNVASKANQTAQRTLVNSGNFNAEEIAASFSRPREVKEGDGGQRGNVSQAASGGAMKHNFGMRKR